MIGHASRRFTRASSRFRIAAGSGLAVAACLLAAAGAAAAVDFPPVTDAERALKSAPGEPNARAVILFRRGDLVMPDPRAELVTSILTVTVREKILTQQGLDEGTVRIHHSSFTRIHGLEGRTVLPDGTVVPLPSEAAYKTTASTARKQYVTTVAFPKVEVGAILDYQYKLYWDEFTFLEPWYFASSVPVMHTEILYHLPAGVRMAIWGFGPHIDEVRTESSSDVRGKTFRVTADNLQSLPSEPYSLPALDFSPRMMLVPHSVSVDGLPVHLLEDWSSTCDLYKGVYKKALRDDSDSAKLARSLVTAADKDVPAKSAKLFRWVRDNVRTDEGAEPEPGKDVTVDKVLARKHGTSNEKALLLLAMLDAVKVPAHVVWAGSRDDGRIDTNVATPAWFSRTLVAVDAGKDRIFLDPADSTAAFGHIMPGFEGTPAVLYDYKKPEVITLPETPFADNRRAARVDLAIGEKGGASGRGTLVLTGQHGWERVGWKSSAEEASAAWKAWLGARLKSYVVSDVTVKESLEESKVEVAWRMEAAEADPAEEEVLVAPAAPLGESGMAGQLPAAGRQTPVVFDYPDRDEVEWHVTWPESWRLEATPIARTHQGSAGALVTNFTIDSAARTIVATRRLDMTRRMTTNSFDYDALRQLLLEAQRSDVQTLVIRRR